MRKTPLAAVYELDIAFNQGDLDATLCFYEDSASIVIELFDIIIKKPVC